MVFNIKTYQYVMFSEFLNDPYLKKNKFNFMISIYIDIHYYISYVQSFLDHLLPLFLPTNFHAKISPYFV